MVTRTCIKQMARQRGMTVAEVARRLRWYPSNLSAMDAGTRAVSLKALARVAELLGCSPADLVEVVPPPEPPAFRKQRMAQWIQMREQETPDGVDRSWTHAALLAWQRHYRTIRRPS